jgi:hypothetical protein
MNGCFNKLHAGHIGYLQRAKVSVRHAKVPDSGTQLGRVRRQDIEVEDGESAPPLGDLAIVVYLSGH